MCINFAPPSCWPVPQGRAGQPQEWQHASPAVRVVAGVAGATSGAAQELGSSKNPIYMMQAAPTFRPQLWRTVRTLAVAFLLISGIGALFDERGLGRGILHNPDMKPQLDSKTKFEDVKGVDEAKVQPKTSLISHAHVYLGSVFSIGAYSVISCFPVLQVCGPQSTWVIVSLI